MWPFKPIYYNELFPNQLRSLLQANILDQITHISLTKNSYLLCAVDIDYQFQ